MRHKHIHQLSAAASVGDEDLFEIEQSGSSLRATRAQILDAVATGVERVDAQSGTNDYEKIAAAITAAASSGRAVWFTPGKAYTATAKITVSFHNNLILLGNGATIQASNATDVPIDSGPGAFQFTDCDGLRVYDLHYDGNNSVRGTTQTGHTGPNYQLYRCKDFIFSRCKSINGAGDGWRVTADTGQADTNTFPRNGKFLHCIGKNNGRNGISFIEALDMLVLGGEYSEHKWFPPMSGIDIEPNSGSAAPGCSRISIIGVTFFDNWNCGVMVTRGAQGNAGVGPVLIEACVFDGNGGRDPAGGTAQSHAPLLIANAHGCTVRGNHFLNCTADGSGTPLLRGVGIYLDSAMAVGQALIEGNFFKGNTGVPVSGFEGNIAGHSAVGASVSIINNFIDLTGSARNAIRAPFANAQIIGNRVISDSGAATPSVNSTGANAQVSDNHVTGDGASIMASGAGTVIGTNVPAVARTLQGEVTLIDYAETSTMPSSSAGTLVLDLNVGSVFEVTLTENVTTLTLSNPPANGKTGSMTLILKQDATGNRTISWPASVLWPGGGTDMVLSTAANAIDVVSLVTRDGGTTWYGFEGGKAFA